MSTIEKGCIACSSIFKASLKEHNRGNAKYCSKECVRVGFSLSRTIVRSSNTTCSTCSTQFFKKESEKKKSKSGHFFCSRVCKDSAQRIGGIPEIMPSHYGNGESRYRARAFAAYDHSCSSCGWNLIDEVLEVHHIDRDRSNGDLSNLVILCPTCHDTEHFMTRTGKWGMSNK